MEFLAIGSKSMGSEVHFIERDNFEVIGSVHLSADNLPLMMDGNLVLLKKMELDRMRNSTNEWKSRYSTLRRKLMGNNVFNYIKNSVVLITPPFDSFTALMTSDAETTVTSEVIDGRVHIEDATVESSSSQNGDGKRKMSPIGQNESKAKRIKKTIDDGCQSIGEPMFPIINSRDRLTELFTLEEMDENAGEEQERNIRCYTDAKKRNLLRVALGLSESLADWFSIPFWEKNKVAKEVS